MRTPTRSRVVHFAAVAAALLLASLLGGVLIAAPLFPNPVYPVGANPYSMDRADFDGDGRADLVVANATQTYYSYETGDLSLLRGLGDGSFAHETRIPLS